MTDLIVSGILMISICGALERSALLGLLGLWSASYLLNDALTFLFQ
jgi:hypothetical protein